MWCNGIFDSDFVMCEDWRVFFICRLPPSRRAGSLKNGNQWRLEHVQRTHSSDSCFSFSVFLDEPISRQNFLIGFGSGNLWGDKRARKMGNSLKFEFQICLSEILSHTYIYEIWVVYAKIDDDFETVFEIETDRPNDKLINYETRKCDRVRACPII